MRDIAATLHGWHGEGREYAVATVVSASKSTPRGLGATLAVDAGGEAAGGLSGGCVEGAVYELCQDVIRSRRPVLERFGPDAGDVFAAGLACGGAIEVFVQPVAPGRSAGFDYGIPAIASGGPVALARVIAGPDELLGGCLAVTADDCRGALGGASALADPVLEHAAVREARAMLAAGRTGRAALAEERCEPAAETVLFVESHLPRPRMLVFGAVDFAAAVARIGVFLGYDVTVCDARPVFATAARFPDADRVVVDWPHRYLEREAAAGALDERTIVCALTHDAKFDIPLLERALRLPLAYVGAMGSRSTQRDRLTGLRAAGLTDTELARLRAPIGLDLGACTAQETAVSIAAEIVAMRRGGGCLPLAAGSGPVHTLAEHVHCA